jgi:hypothetical protein
MVEARNRTLIRRTLLAAVLMLAVVPAIRLAAHVVVGYGNPTLAKAFVSSPTAAGDALIPITWGTEPNRVDTGLSVACFYVANSSPARPDDDDWPRITAAGFELPGVRSGFTLISASTPGWGLEEGIAVTIPGRTTVMLDFALVAPVNPMGRSTAGTPQELLGIPPRQDAVRRSGTRFCVAGPFPQGFNIEQILNGVVTRFHGVHPNGPSIDYGLWDNALRTIPLF